MDYVHGARAQMTVAEFYEWCREHGAEDYDLTVTYRDGGGYLTGRDEWIEPEIKHEQNRGIVEI